MDNTKPLQLLGLYLSQGAPYGVQSTIVPLLFRQWGKSYNSNAMAHLAFLPWGLKPLVAPYFEKSSIRSISVTLLISGCIQLLMCLALLRKSSRSMIGLLLLSNVFTALYDILVDKLAIKHRAESELDLANVFQVVGYKLGSLLSGALTLFTVTHYFNGNSERFALSPLISAAILLSMAFWTYLSSLNATNCSNSSSGTIKKTGSDLSTSSDVPGEKQISHAYSSIWKHFCNHKSLYALVITYKAGETIGDTLFKTFLRDSGFNLKLLATSNVVNECVSIAGSLTMIRRQKQKRSPEGDIQQLRRFLLLNIIPQCLRAFIVCNKSAQQFFPVASITLIENFIGGAVTVACFNFMFSNVIPSIEGTHYALYASLEALGKILTGAVANFAVASVGFEAIFLSAIVLSFIPVLLTGRKSMQRTELVDVTNKLF